MLTTIFRALRWIDQKLENLLADLAANYARELLAANGLVEIEIDHIRRTSRPEPDAAPIESEKINRSITSSEIPLPKTFLEVVRAERTIQPAREIESIRASAPNCELWSGPEIVAALSIAGAVIAALLFCLAAIFKC